MDLSHTQKLMGFYLGYSLTGAITSKNAVTVFLESIPHHGRENLLPGKWKCSVGMGFLKRVLTTIYIEITFTQRWFSFKKKRIS